MAGQLRNLLISTISHCSRRIFWIFIFFNLNILSFNFILMEFFLHRGWYAGLKMIFLIHVGNIDTVHFSPTPSYWRLIPSSPLCRSIIGRMNNSNSYFYSDKSQSPEASSSGRSFRQDHSRQDELYSSFVFSLLGWYGNWRVSTDSSATSETALELNSRTLLRGRVC